MMMSQYDTSIEHCHGYLHMSITPLLLGAEKLATKQAWQPQISITDDALTDLLNICLQRKVDKKREERRRERERNYLLHIDVDLSHVGPGPHAPQTPNRKGLLSAINLPSSRVVV
ncbi:hypothetical protein ACN38_g10792 [Penicillium nordicum]|uniref:Uncharacterized protein n=1 Tax=Penicillium nordicum TaxID=229535 RepID=A0A0M8P0Z5_9EURO|nr:hypothetical protein ACN38_g10792 [Penicillium nordicum]